MKITLVRHAEVQEKYIGKYNGHIDIALSENGKLQSKKLAKSLSHENFDKVYCSDLLRARQTLEAFDLDCEIVFTCALREKSWGKHEGKSFEEIQKSGIVYENFTQWVQALDGEDIMLYTKDIENYFNNTILKNDKNHILILSHAGCIKSILSLVNNISLEKAFSTSLAYSSSIHLDIK
ncbi:MAG: histidine phosphatase family protein [Sulfurimonas sp.]|nr:histidine phosphatase family protein [Sulfurimonas sp.]PHQ92510.1 MAG: phosphoglycerate mutase [Sulfurimonas sp.]